jgi:Sulfite exporter TauE/SafE.
MEIAGYLASIFIGVALGLIGGGGSILTVPVLVYLFSVDAVLATAYSLFIVGTTSVVGSFSYFKKVWLISKRLLCSVFRPLQPFFLQGLLSFLPFRKKFLASEILPLPKAFY